MNSEGSNGQQQTIIYAVCHVMGMLSACANPIIYGFLNENFSREFKELYKSLKQSCFKNHSSLHSRSQDMEEDTQIHAAQPLMLKHPDDNPQVLIQQ